MPRVKCHLYKLSNLLFRALGTPGTNELLPRAASRKCALHLPMRDSSVLRLCKLSPLSDKSEELLQSWLNHCLYGSKHHSAHKRNNFSWTLTTVEFSPSSFPESKKETTQKISLVAERAVKDWQQGSLSQVEILRYPSFRSPSRVRCTRCESQNYFSGYVWLIGYFTLFLLYSSYSVYPCEVKKIHIEPDHHIELDHLTGLII